MSVSVDALGIYGFVIVLAVLVHEPWRWLGLLLARKLSTGSEVFVWVRCVTTALVAGLALRLVLFPAGALASVGATVRVGALVAALAVFMIAGRSLGAGVIAGAVFVLAGVLIGG